MDQKTDSRKSSRSKDDHEDRWSRCILIKTCHPELASKGAIMSTRLAESKSRTAMPCTKPRIKAEFTFGIRVRHNGRGHKSKSGLERVQYCQLSPQYGAWVSVMQTMLETNAVGAMEEVLRYHLNGATA